MKPKISKFTEKEAKEIREQVHNPRISTLWFFGGVGALGLGGLVAYLFEPDWAVHLLSYEMLEIGALLGILVFSWVFYGRF